LYELYIELDAYTLLISYILHISGIFQKPLPWSPGAASHETQFWVFLWIAWQWKLTRQATWTNFGSILMFWMFWD